MTSSRLWGYTSSRTGWRSRRVGAAPYGWSRRTSCDSIPCNEVETTPPACFRNTETHPCSPSWEPRLAWSPSCHSDNSSQHLHPFCKSQQTLCGNRAHFRPSRETRWRLLESGSWDAMDLKTPHQTRLHWEVSEMRQITHYNTDSVRVSRKQVYNKRSKTGIGVPMASHLPQGWYVVGLHAVTGSSLKAMFRCYTVSLTNTGLDRQSK